MTGLTEVRDLREVQTIATAMDMINRRELSQAMDVLAQRVVSIQRAKQKGGTWEAAELLELMPGSGASMAPGGLLTLGK